MVKERSNAVPRFMPHAFWRNVSAAASTAVHRQLSRPITIEAPRLISQPDFVGLGIRSGYTVSTRDNSVKNDDEALIEEVATGSA